MGRPQHRAVWGVVALGLVVLTALAWRVTASHLPASVHDGATIALFLTAAAIAAVAYRDSSDPAMVFVGAGAVAYGLSSLVFFVVWPARSVVAPVPPGRHDDLPLLAMLAATLALGACLLAVVPWWERRGRAPLSAVKVVAGVLGGLFVVVGILYVFPPPRVVRAAGGAVSYVLGPVPWLLALAGLMVTAVAAWRSNMASERGAFFGLVGIASAATATWPLAVLLSRSGSISVQEVAQGWLTTGPLIAGVALVAALLTSQHGERRTMRRTTDRAEAVLDGRAEIASMVAHEVRGPVATIRGIASTSLTHYDRLADEERREFLQMIETESRRLMTTVDQTSLALKVDAGTITYEMKPNDLTTVVREGVERAEAGGHAVTVEPAADVTVVCDRQRIAEVVRQLIDNAAKFSPDGSPITVTVHREGADAVIDVTDEGPGIATDQRDRVFERYPNWRPAGYEEQPGSGLGLFIARGLLAEHSGDVHVEDRPRGTMLRVRLPSEG